MPAGRPSKLTAKIIEQAKAEYQQSLVVTEEYSQYVH